MSGGEIFDPDLNGPPSTPVTEFWSKPAEWKCPGCGCQLEPYEIFAARIRGLKRPVCLGCLVNALIFLRDYVKPMLEKALEELEAKAL